MLSGYVMHVQHYRRIQCTSDQYNCMQSRDTALHCTKLSLYIELHLFNGSSTINVRPAQPHLYVVSGGGGEVFSEPWGGVERAAAASSATLAVPEWISSLHPTITVSTGASTYGSVAEVVISNIAGNI